MSSYQGMCDSDPLATKSYWVDDLSGNGEMNWVGNVNGASASNTVFTQADESHPGVRACASGTSSTGRATVRMTSTSYIFGGAFHWLSAVWKTTDLSTAAQEYLAWCGYADSIAAESVDGAYFYYDRATSGDFFIAVTASNSARTKTVTSVPIVAGQWYFLKIEVNRDGTQVRFFIDNVLVATTTTNIPTGAGRGSAPTWGGRKTAGTTSVGLGSMDLFQGTFMTNAPRFV